ncbi:aspartate/glutamate racemase family protein [Verticiella sediminum]|uniref:Hydantoin racemase n=1 Tax=Verticiella sediminum TaxID=1247510 RepID=A0A556B1Z9_9BURK|nr:aspartate/glutamate racemase family protein [Verticiella sediminum]TSH99184.1 aspartate/glutamate racemase family protein [Verticiella sediminum]
MRLCVINPNTSSAMTLKIGEQARRAAGPGTEILAVNPDMGPASIESHYDDAVAVLGVLDVIRRGEAQGCDGYVLACFGDPGLAAAREAARGPVIGIAEAAMHAASFVATGFSVVTTLTRTCVIAEHLAEAYGMARFCRSVRGTDIPVLDLEHDDPAAYAEILAACRRALSEDRSGAIVLGCAGMSDLALRLRTELGVPVIDGVGMAVRLVESLVALGIATSKQGDYADPIPKPYTGLTAGFARTARTA